MKSNAAPIYVFASLLCFACADPDGGAPRGSRAAPVLGGLTDTGDPAVVGIYFPTMGGFICTGMVVSTRVVLTAGHCVKEPLDAGQVTQGLVTFGYNLNDPTRTVGIVDARFHRYYDAEQVGYYDVGLLLLAEDAGVTPVVLNETPLTEILDSSQMVRAVGFGSNQIDPESGAGIKRHAEMPVRSIAARHIIYGASGNATCHGDSGGPLFFTTGGVEQVVAIVSYTRFGCTGTEVATRADAFTDDFIYPQIDAWDGPCRLDGTCVTNGCRTVDPDCDPCGLDGTCAAGCPAVDWDCPIGKLLGETCATDDDCETRRCIPATDDPRILYCSEACDPAETGFCGTTMQCSSVGGEDLCSYAEPTPGAQGYACQTGAACRSGLCDLEFRICVEECDPAAADACPASYECSPSSLADHVCRPPSDSGGCQAIPARRAPVSIAFAALVLAGLTLAWRARRGRELR